MPTLGARRPLSGRIARPSSQRRGQLAEIGHDEVGLMRRLPERPLPAVDERRPHAVGFRADAIEGVIGDEEDARAIEADDLGCLGVGPPVRLEIPRLLHRNDVIEPKSDMRPRGLQHIAVTVREDRELVSPGPQLLECRDDVRKRFQLLDLGYEPAHLVLRVSDAAAVHDVRDRAMPNLPVRRVPTIAEGVDHGVLEVGAAPPGDEAVR